MKDEQEHAQESKNSEIQKICSIVGAGVGAVTAFVLGGETWGWFWLFLFTPLGAGLGRLCGWLFTVSASDLRN